MADGTPTSTDPKLTNSEDEMISAGVMPVPESATFCALFWSLMVSVPVMAVAVKGVKITEKVHEEPAARVPPQLLMTVKAPLIAVLIALSGRPPELVMVTVMGWELLVWTVFGKARAVVERESVAAVTPVPDNWAVWVPALVTTVSVPDAVPAAVGAKAMVATQEALAASVDPQV